MQLKTCSGTACALAAVLLVFTAPPARALIDDATAAALTANLDALSAAENAGFATDTAQMLLNPQATDADWTAFFTIYFQTRLFTQPLYSFFTFAAQQPATAAHAAFVEATAAAASSGRMLSEIATTGRPGDFGSLLYSLNALQSVLAMLSDQSRGEMFTLMTRDLQGRTLDLTAVLAPGPGVNAPTAMLGMQICLTLAAYAGPGAQQSVGPLLRLPDRMRTFWQSTGVFLFDNGALNDLQAASLDSLMRAFPSNLHQIVALLAAEAYGLDPTLPSLVVAGQIVLVPSIAMDVETNPAEFADSGPSPVVPDFTATAATNVFRAVQLVQFARRPQLALRRDAILARCGTRIVCYLRRGVAPELYIENPAEFLPMTAYLWLINSDAAFRMGMGLFRLSQSAPVESLLLVADVLSDGTDSTPTFAISPTGVVSSATTQIGRVAIQPAWEDVIVLPYPQVNSIRMLGRIFEFGLGYTADLVRLFWQGDVLP